MRGCQEQREEDRVRALAEAGQRSNRRGGLAWTGPPGLAKNLASIISAMISHLRSVSEALSEVSQDL